MFFIIFYVCFVVSYVFFILGNLCFCIVLCIVSPFLYSCIFPILVQVQIPLPPGGNPAAVNKYIIYQNRRHATTFLITISHDQVLSCKFLISSTCQLKRGLCCVWHATGLSFFLSSL